LLRAWLGGGGRCEGAACGAAGFRRVVAGSGLERRRRWAGVLFETAAYSNFHQIQTNQIMPNNSQKTVSLNAVLGEYFS
jgi:hypothetical protein